MELKIRSLHIFGRWHTTITAQDPSPGGFPNFEHRYTSSTVLDPSTGASLLLDADHRSGFSVPFRGNFPHYFSKVNTSHCNESEPSVPLPLCSASFLYSILLFYYLLCYLEIMSLASGEFEDTHSNTCRISQEALSSAALHDSG